MIISSNGINDFRTAITEEPPRVHRAWDAPIQPIYELMEALRAEGYQASIRTTPLTPDRDKIDLRLGPKYRPAHEETFLTFILNALTGETTIVPLLGAPMKKPEEIRDHLTELMHRPETRHYLAHLRELETKPVEAIVIHKEGSFGVTVDADGQKDLATTTAICVNLCAVQARGGPGQAVPASDFIFLSAAGLNAMVVGGYVNSLVSNPNNAREFSLAVTPLRML
jgi:hypothetical protein